MDDGIKSMTRILVFSPYALWTIHTIYEETIAKACSARGGSVEYLLCDGLLPECDQHWDSKSSSRPLDICRRCKASAKSHLDAIDLPYGWLGEYVSEVEKAAAFNWAQSLPATELRQANFRQMPLGEWVLSSVISYFRQYPPDMANWHVVSVYRGFIFSGAMVATGIENYLRTHAIDAALLFNGRQSITRVAFEVFRAHGIRVLTHERAEYQRGHLNARPNAHCMSPEPFRDFWKMWADIPLTREALEATLKWRIQRRYGANLAWIPFNKSSIKSGAQDSATQGGRQRQLWALFTSSTDEVAGDPLMRGPYESQADWVRDVVQWVAKRDDVELIIKVHPNLGGNQYIGRATDELKIYQEMKTSLPSQVKMLMPEDPANAYALAEAADVGLTFGSTIGLEMAMLGKPVLVASRASYEQGKHILTLRSRESLEEMLERCLNARSDTEIQREAFRLAYYYIFAFERPFSAVKVLGLYEAEVSPTLEHEMVPGSGNSLDAMCKFLLEGDPLFKRPNESDLARTTEDEDAFFARLGRPQDYLRDARYERWLRFQSLGRSTRDHLRRLPFGTGDLLLNFGRSGWHAILKRMEAET